MDINGQVTLVTYQPMTNWRVATSPSGLNTGLYKPFLKSCHNNAPLVELTLCQCSLQTDELTLCTKCSKFWAWWKAQPAVDQEKCSARPPDQMYNRKCHNLNSEIKKKYILVDVSTSVDIQNSTVFVTPNFLKLFPAISLKTIRPPTKSFS